MGQSKQNFNGGSRITNMFTSNDYSSNTKLYMRLQGFVHQKSDLGTSNIYVWLLSFQNGAQGSYTWWWCTAKK